MVGDRNSGIHIVHGRDLGVTVLDPNQESLEDLYYPVYPVSDALKFIWHILDGNISAYFPEAFGRRHINNPTD
jgi:hypothetical protein